MPHAEARVLIVDGQVNVARLVAKIFGVAGLPNTDVAFDTPTAREQMEARPPDIVILDARIAPMNVTAFITLARKLTNGQAVTLMMTTSRTAEGVDAAREAGVDGILVKPFTPSDLRSELTLAKERKRSSPARNRERAQQADVVLD
jgi:two-component system chemotaxis response regulator CheY